MTGKTNQKQAEPRMKSDIVVFGLDESGKPKGARFPAKLAEQIAPALTAMKLEWRPIDTDQMKELAKKLPLGRVYAKGRAFVPYIKRELYDKVLSLPGDVARENTAPPPESMASSGADTEQPVVLGLPRYWDSIGPGHLVLVHDGPGEGWWEGVVVARTDQMLSLRYRDYPKQKQFERHISTVALINPGPQ